MIAARSCLVVAVLLVSVKAEYRILVRQEGGPLVELGGSVTITCSASRDAFWFATDLVTFQKKQGADDYVDVTLYSPTVKVSSTFQPRYSANLRQSVQDTVTLSLTITGFRHEDSGTYRCMLLGPNSNQAQAQNLTIFSVLTATVSLTSQARLEDDVRVYSYYDSEQTTTCDVSFYGTGLPLVEIIYGSNEITNDFQESKSRVVDFVGNTIGLKTPVQRRTYNTSSFYPSDVNTPLKCTALNDRHAELASSYLSVRSQKKPSLICDKQNPSVVALGVADITISCTLRDYIWSDNASVITWAFTYNAKNGQVKNVTLRNGENGYNRAAKGDALQPQLTIILAEEDTLLYPDYVVSLIHGGRLLATGAYRLNVDVSKSKSESRSNSASGYAATTAVVLMSIFISVLV